MSTHSDSENVPGYFEYLAWSLSRSIIVNTQLGVCDVVQYYHEYLVFLCGAV